MVTGTPFVSYYSVRLHRLVEVRDLHSWCSDTKH